MVRTDRVSSPPVTAAMPPPDSIDTHRQPEIRTTDAGVVTPHLMRRLRDAALAQTDYPGKDDVFALLVVHRIFVAAESRRQFRFCRLESRE